jgi:hypothetical protein
VQFVADLQAHADAESLIICDVAVDFTIARARRRTGGSADQSAGGSADRRAGGPARRRCAEKGDEPKEPPGDARCAPAEHGLGWSWRGSTARVHLSAE